VTRLWAVGEPDTILTAIEADVLEESAITPEPTDEPHNFPTVRWSWWPDEIYLPAVSVLAANQSAACGSAGQPSGAIAATADRTARHHSAGGPMPQPTLGRLHALTAAEADELYGTTLAGAVVGGRTVDSSECIWWATYHGWFDCFCDELTPPVARHVWQRMDMALLSDVGTVIYDQFSDYAEPPPTGTAPVAPRSTPTDEGVLPTPTRRSQ
jgi:hypothetical protein